MCPQLNEHGEAVSHRRQKDYASPNSLRWRYISYIRSEAEADKSFTALKSLHSAVKFTMEKEANQTLPFLDVKIEKDNSQSLTSIYMSIYSVEFISTIEKQNQLNWNSSTPSTGYLFQKHTSTRTTFDPIYLAVKWLPWSDN